MNKFIKNIGKIFTHQQALKWALLTFVISYSMIWLYAGHNMKHRMIAYIEQYNEQNPHIALKYDNITTSGYPLQLNANINNLKIEVDSAYAGSLVASFIETEDNAFPKLAHRAIFSSVNQPVVVHQDIFQKKLSISIPNEIISQHILEGQLPINLMHRFNGNPYIILTQNQPITFKSLLNKMRWLDLQHDFSISIPSYSTYDLSNYHVINNSKGTNFSLESKESSDKGLIYNLDYSDHGTTYNPPIDNMLKLVMNTSYLKHLKGYLPLFYEELSNTSSYSKSGENSLNFNINCTIRPDTYDEENSIEFDIIIKKLEHRNAFGSFSGDSKVKAVFDSKSNKIKLNKQGYFSMVFNEDWHQKWSKNISQAFSHINSKSDAWHQKIALCLPQAHNYQYTTISYKATYDGDYSLSLIKNINLDYLKLQTDQFLIQINKGPDYGLDLKKLPLNFVIYLHNHQKLMQIGWEYLGIFLYSNPHGITPYTMVHPDLLTFLDNLAIPNHKSKNDWVGNAKYEHGSWHLGDQSSSSMQSSLLSIILKHQPKKQ